MAMRRTRGLKPHQKARLYQKAWGSISSNAALSVAFLSGTLYLCGYSERAGLLAYFGLSGVFSTDLYSAMARGTLLIVPIASIVGLILLPIALWDLNYSYTVRYFRHYRFTREFYLRRRKKVLHGDYQLLKPAYYFLLSYFLFTAAAQGLGRLEGMEFLKLGRVRRCPTLVTEGGLIAGCAIASDSERTAILHPDGTISLVRWERVTGLIPEKRQGR